jgi:hypothetical protein
MNPPDFVYADSFGDWIVGFQTFVTGQPWYLQLAIIVGLVAATVAAFTVVYYVIKGVIYLITQIFKLLWSVLGAIFKKPVTNHPTAQPAPVTPSIQVTIPSPQPVTVNAQPVQTTIKPKEPGKKFCPMCGEVFTDKMMQLLTGQARVFCEFCGAGIDQ